MRSGLCGMTRLWGADLPLADAVYSTFAWPQAPAIYDKRPYTSNSVWKRSFQRYQSYHAIYCADANRLTNQKHTDWLTELMLSITLDTKQVILGMLFPEIPWLVLRTQTHTTISRLSGLCPGQPRWTGAGTRRNRHPLTRIVVISHPLSASSIYYDPWHSPCSIYMSDSLLLLWSTSWPGTPASHHSVFYRSDARPAAQPTASRHWN